MQSRQWAGAIGAWVVGVTYVVAAAAHGLSPADGRAAAGATRFWPAIADQPSFVTVVDVALLGGAIFALAAVPAIGRLYGRAAGGWLDWATSVGLLGYAATAITDATALGRTHTVAAAYVGADASARNAIAAEPILLIDAFGLLMFGAIGVWLIVLNGIAMSSRMTPRWLAVVGVGAGCGYLVISIGFVSGVDAVVTAGAVVSGLVLAPVWFIANGYVLWRHAAQI